MSRLCGESSRAPHGAHTCMHARGARLGQEGCAGASGCEGLAPQGVLLFPCTNGRHSASAAGQRDTSARGGWSPFPEPLSRPQLPGVFCRLAVLRLRMARGPGLSALQPCSTSPGLRDSAVQRPRTGAAGVWRAGTAGRRLGEGVAGEEEGAEASVGLSTSGSPGSRSVSGQGSRSLREGRAAEQRESAAELSPWPPAFPGATATAVSPPPLQSVAAVPRSRAPRRQPPRSPSAEPRAEERGAGARAAAREPRRGRGRAEGGAGREGEGRERSERERAGESERKERELGRGKERKGEEKDTRTQRHTVTGIPLEKSEPSKG